MAEKDLRLTNVINQLILKEKKQMSTIEKLSIPAGCSLEFTGPTGKPVKIMSVDELRDVIAKTDAAKKRDTGDLLPKEELEKRREAIAAAIKSVYEVMFTGKCLCKCKGMYEQFSFFVNDILMPNTLPGYKCVIEPIVMSTFDIEGNLIKASNEGVRISFRTIDDYNKYWVDRTIASRKCLASKNDLKKICGALEPTPRKVDPSLIIPLSQLLLNKNSSQSEVTVAINTFLAFIKSKYGVDLSESIVGTDTIGHVSEVLNLVIKFVNKKFNKNIKTIKDTDKFGRRVNACISILKLLKAVKQSKKTEKK